MGLGAVVRRIQPIGTYEGRPHGVRREQVGQLVGALPPARGQAVRISLPALVLTEWRTVRVERVRLLPMSDDHDRMRASCLPDRVRRHESRDYRDVVGLALVAGALVGLALPVEGVVAERVAEGAVVGDPDADAEGELDAEADGDGDGGTVGGANGAMTCGGIHGGVHASSALLVKTQGANPASHGRGKTLFQLVPKRSTRAATSVPAKSTGYGTTGWPWSSKSRTSVSRLPSAS